MATTEPADFEEWKSLFERWQQDIGFDTDLLGDFEFTAKYDEPESPVIQFGNYKGQPKWKHADELPTQDMRDMLLKQLVIQGDTEFASVEQQRELLATAPSDYDLKSGVRYLAEEMRHGWQLSHLLIEHYGGPGKKEAARMFERNADDGDRILDAFNEKIDNWLEFFMFRNYIDRDGKYQLMMQSHSGFQPLAQAMRPMLIEEAFHYGSGHTGMRRVLAANKVPVELFQKYTNKWISLAHDLFGGDADRTFSAAAYEASLKSRFDELENPEEADLTNINDYNRHLYREEVVGITEELNSILRNRTDQEARLTVPDIRFNRRIGRHADEHWSVTGERLTEEEWAEHAQEVLPTEEDHKRLHEILDADTSWIIPKGPLF